MRQISSEAVRSMPVERVEAVFGDASVVNDAEFGAISEQAKVTDGYVRTLFKIPETFGSGANRETWTQQANTESVGGIHVWAGGIQAARQQIADAAGHNVKDFDRTVNNIWQHFAGSQTARCPDLFEFADLDAEIAIKVAFPKYPMEVAVGFGGTNDTDVSSRAFGWVMPAFSFARAFKRARATPPSVRVFFAHELSDDVNHDLDSNIAQRTSERIGAAVSQFADIYYPDVNDSVRLSTTRLEAVQQSLGKLGITTGNGNASALLEEIGVHSPELVPFIQRLQDAGKKEGKGSDEDGTARYVTYHVAPEVFATYVDPSAGNVSAIKFGGPSEREFTALQRAIATCLSPADQSGLSRTHDFARQFTTSGPQQIWVVGNNHSTAPYYHDPQARDVRILADGSLRTNAGKPDRDTSMAEHIAGGREPLIAFMGDILLPEYSS